MKMVDYVYSSANKYPNNIAYEFMGKKTSYHEFINQIETCAKSLILLGIKANDIVCIAMPNTPQAIIMIYAINKIGATIYMLHPLSSESEFKLYINKVNAKTILILDQFYPTFAKIKDQTSITNVIVANVSEALPIVKKVLFRLTNKNKYDIPYDNCVVSWKDFYDMGKACIPLSDHLEDNNHIALILNSGGTSGKSKGVCLSNNNVNSSATQMIKANPMLDPHDKFLSVMPIFHGNGLVIGIHVMLVVGARCVLIPRFKPETYARDLLRTKCNYMSGVPALFERLINLDIMKKANLSFLKGCFSGADSLSIELENRINEFLTSHHALIKVRQGYGMTEGVVASTLCPFDNAKVGSIGKPLDGVSVKIVYPGTHDETLVNEVGEICFSSSTTMLGYYQDIEETNHVLQIHDDGNTWVHSGDLGCVDEEGFIYFKGRIKRMIVTNGYNVYPNELENIIESFDMVDRCCILGINRTQGTQIIKAFILLKEGFPKTDEVKNEIITLCRKEIARYSLPKEITFVDAMPTTKIGKVDYNKLLELYQ